MCLIKNKNVQKISGDNNGKIAGRDIVDIYNDNSKKVTIVQNFYNATIEEVKKFYSEEYKNYVNSFKELEGYLYSLIFSKSSEKYQFSSNYLNFAKELLDWIMGNSDFPEKTYKKFCDELICIYKIDTNDVILKRWSAFEKYFTSNISETVNIYNEIFKDIINLKCPSDLLDDILIDGRNVLNEMEQLNNKIIVDNPFQKELDKHNRKLTMPIYDRLKADSYEKVLKDTFTIETKDSNTIIFGSGLESVLNEIQNLIFNTVFYGSITHMKLCREVISNVMYSYSKIHKNEKFYKITLKMLALSGEYKEYEKLCLFLGNSQEFWCSSSFIEEILNLKNRSLDYKKINYLNFIYGFYGKYLSDKDYQEIEKNIFEYLKNIDAININLALIMFKNIKVNINRIQNLEEIINIFEIFIKKGFSRFYHEISYILNSIDVKALKPDIYKRYVEIVYQISSTSKYVDLKFSIANILNKNKYARKFYKYKKNLAVKELISFEKEISENYTFLKKMIEDYDKWYKEKEEKPEIVVAYDVSYLLSRRFFIQVFENQNIVNLIKEVYLPLVSRILESEKQTNTFKIEQLKNLLYISSIEDYKFMKESINNIISKINYGYGKESTFCNCFNYTEISNYEIDLYIKLISAFLKEDTDFNDIVTQCYEDNFYDKISIELISNCLKVIGDSQKDNKLILNQIYCFYIAVSENDYIYKLKTIDLLSIFSNTNFEQKTIELLEKYSLNCSFDIAKKILNIIREFDSEKTIRILTNLKAHNNFNVRTIAKNYKDKK